MKAIVTVMLKNGVLDPQGKAIGHALSTLGFQGVGDVRVDDRCVARARLPLGRPAIRVTGLERQSRDHRPGTCNPRRGDELTPTPKKGSSGVADGRKIGL